MNTNFVVHNEIDFCQKDFEIIVQIYKKKYNFY